MIRDVDVPQSLMNALDILKSLQKKLKDELGPEGYSDYDLLICQANGHPMMTEHINKRFKELLREMNDPEIDPLCLMVIIIQLCMPVDGRTLKC